jgi:hypothetical protein
VGKVPVSALLGIVEPNNALAGTVHTEIGLLSQAYKIHEFYNI